MDRTVANENGRKVKFPEAETDRARDFRRSVPWISSHHTTDEPEADRTLNLFQERLYRAVRKKIVLCQPLVIKELRLVFVS